VLAEGVSDATAALEEEARAAHQRWRSIAPSCEDAKGAELLEKMPTLLDHLLYEETHNLPWLRGICSQGGLSGATALCQLRQAVQPGAELLLELKLGSDERTRAITGAKVGRSLLDKIRYDLRIAGGLKTGAVPPRYIDWYSAPSGPEEPEHVRSRLHFTHRSHLSAVLAVLEYLCPEAAQEISTGLSSEVQFCSHLVLQVFKDGPNLEPYVTLGYSPGVPAFPSGSDDCSSVREARTAWRGLPLSSVDRLLTSALACFDNDGAETTLPDSEMSTIEANLDEDIPGARKEPLLQSDESQSRACSLL